MFRFRISDAFNDSAAAPLRRPGRPTRAAVPVAAYMSSARAPSSAFARVSKCYSTPIGVIPQKRNRSVARSAPAAPPNLPTPTSPRAGQQRGALCAARGGGDPPRCATDPSPAAGRPICRISAPPVPDIGQRCDKRRRPTPIARRLAPDPTPSRAHLAPEPLPRGGRRTGGRARGGGGGVWAALGRQFFIAYSTRHASCGTRRGKEWGSRRVAQTSASKLRHGTDSVEFEDVAERAGG